MIAWWETLTTLEHILLYIAVPATLILIIQTLLLLMGGGMDAGEAESGGPDWDAGGGDLDTDWDAGLDGNLDAGLDGPDWEPGAGLEADAPHGDDFLHDAPDLEESSHAAAGLHLFTLRGIVAFLTLFGWGSLWLCQLGMLPAIALFLGVWMGLAGMVAIAVAVRQAVRLQYDGTLDIRNAVGLTGSVYLTIPAARAGAGKVNVLVQEQLREFDAVSDSALAIPTGADIVVTGLAGRDTLIVSPK